MAIRNQGTELNRTITNFSPAGDFGAFAAAHFSIILRGDPTRQLNITGFNCVFTVGSVPEIDPNHFMQVGLVENQLVSPDTSTYNFPVDLNKDLRFYFSKTGPLFVNEIKEQFTVPFKLAPGVNYSFVFAVTDAGPIATTTTTRMTLFGYEQTDEEKNPYFKYPR